MTQVNEKILHIDTFIMRPVQISDLDGLVESRGGIVPRPSPLDPYVMLSHHTAPDVL